MDKAIERFQTDPKCCFLLASRGVAGAGINLGFVDIMIMLEPSYHLAETQHLVGRLQRIGQKPRNISVQQVIEFVLKGTCEENIVDSKCIQDLSFLK